MSDIFLHGARLPWPVDWTAHFGREAPLVMEIGFGNGEFLLQTAVAKPEWNWLGVEISLPSLRKAARKVRQAGLHHVSVVQSDAAYVLQALCPPQSVSGLFINFPDPWPKADQVHRRLINHDFLALAASRLRPGAFLNIATDHSDYQEWVEACLAATPYFDSRLDNLFLTGDPARVVTKYEEKAQREGRQSRYYKWQRNDAPAPPCPVLQELPMTHVVLDLPLAPAEIAARFEQMTIQDEQVVVRLMQAFAAAGAPVLLVETFINEAPLSQRLGLMVRRRRTGDYVVTLHEIGFPRPTWGTHLAVAKLTAWLLSLHPDATLTDSTLRAEAATAVSLPPVAQTT